MSIRFDGTSSTIANSDILPGIAGTTVLTISFWLWWNSFANNDALAFEYTTAFSNYFATRGFIINPNKSSTTNFVVGVGDIAGASYCHFPRPSAQEWHHYVVCFDRPNANGASAVYVDGVSQTLTNGGTSTEAQAESFEFGGQQYFLYFLSRRNASLFGSGKLAEVSVFPATTLSAEEAVALYRGVSPLDLRQDLVPYYFPLDGDDAIVRRQIGNQVSNRVDNLSAVILDEHPPIALDFDDWNESTVSVLEIGEGGGTAHEVAFNSILSSLNRENVSKATPINLGFFGESRLQVGDAVSVLSSFSSNIRSYTFIDVSIESPTGESLFTSNLSSYMRSGIFEHIFRQNQFQKPSVWLALCSQAPAATGNSDSMNEIPFGGGYARINMTGNSIWSTPQKVDNQYQVYNAQEVTFGPSQSNWGWISGWAIVDGSGANSNLIILGDGISKYVYSDDMVKFPTGSIYIKMGSVL